MLVITMLAMIWVAGIRVQLAVAAAIDARVSTPSLEMIGMIGIVAIESGVGKKRL
jgi:hypothetical protein